MSEALPSERDPERDAAAALWVIRCLGIAAIAYGLLSLVALLARSGNLIYSLWIGTASRYGTLAALSHLIIDVSSLLLVFIGIFCLQTDFITGLRWLRRLAPVIFFSLLLLHGIRIATDARGDNPQIESAAHAWVTFQWYVPDFVLLAMFWLLTKIVGEKPLLAGDELPDDRVFGPPPPQTAAPASSSSVQPISYFVPAVVPPRRMDFAPAIKHVARVIAIAAIATGLAMGLTFVVLHGSFNHQPYRWPWMDHQLDIQLDSLGWTLRDFAAPLLLAGGIIALKRQRDAWRFLLTGIIMTALGLLATLLAALTHPGRNAFYLLDLCALHLKRMVAIVLLLALVSRRVFREELRGCPTNTAQDHLNRDSFSATPQSPPSH